MSDEYHLGPNGDGLPTGDVIQADELQEGDWFTTVGDRYDGHLFKRVAPDPERPVLPGSIPVWYDTRKRFDGMAKWCKVRRVPPPQVH